MASSLALSMEFERSISRKQSGAGDLATFIKPQFLGILRGNSESSDESEAKMSWLQSQLIGNDVEFDTPFGRRFMTYADHTASGRSLRYIEDYIVSKVLPYYGNTHTDDSHVGHVMSKMVHDASDFVKKCMGGGHQDVLLFCGSGTTAAIKRLQEVMGIAVPSILRERVLKTLSDEERWVVFIGPYEHHSNILSWRQSLAEVVEIGMDDGGLIDVEKLKNELESTKYNGRPKLGSFSACSNVTGIHTDTRALARLLHRHGAFACFDFAASGPYDEIDMRSGEVDGYDAVYLSPHKFLGGPGTPGVLLMNKALYMLKTSPPSTCGGGTVCYVNGFSEKDTIYYDNVEEREDAGTPQITQKIRTALTFWVKDYIGSGLIDLHERLYIEVAFKRLLPNPNIYVLGNTSVRRQPIVSFLVVPGAGGGRNRVGGGAGQISQLYRNEKGKPLHGRFVARLFNDLFGIQARGGCACAGPYGHALLSVDEDLSLALRSALQKGYEGLKPGWTRVSFSYYMSKEEFAFVLAAMEFIAEHGHRFLPLYHLDWKTGNWTFRKRTLKYHAMREELANALSDLSLSTDIAGSAVMSPAAKVAGWSFDKELKGNMSDFSPTANNNSNNRFASYMEAAKGIARLLPESPTPRRIPEDIDLNLVLFRV